MNKAKQFLLLIMAITCVFEIVGMKVSKSSVEVARLIVDVCPLDIVIIGGWLNEKRKAISDEKDWTAFVDTFVSDMNKFIAGSSKSGKLPAIRDIIKDVALNLEPFEDCSVELLNRVQAKKSAEKAKSKL